MKQQAIGKDVTILKIFLKLSNHRGCKGRSTMQRQIGWVNGL
jgi:hypothetical protein